MNSLKSKIRNETIKMINENIIQGGKGDDTTEQDVDPRELEIGIAVEKEHTVDADKAKEIAL